MIVQMKEGEDLTNQINRVTLETTKRNPPSENLQEDFWYAEKNDYGINKSNDRLKSNRARGSSWRLLR